ncbi:MAG TPA: pyruvate, water dikinase regulatory protein [Tissierellaceae bacterium]|nr:pyruvate, water dikinase regulatory protein [Tissierellaceae bacterium]
MDGLNIFIISDSLGETGTLVAKAAMSQFKGEHFHLRRFPYIYDIEQLKEILEEACSVQRAIIIYTLVDQELAKYIKEYTLNTKLESIDLMSPLLDTLSVKTGTSPSREPGVIRKLDSEYFEKVAAIEFAVKYDDGRDPRGIRKADIVLLGISRTSKTPLSMYLANRNIKVANVPLVMEVEPPKEIFEIPSKKIIGLTNSPESLNQIRTERLRALGLGVGANYASLERILDELEYAESIMKRIGCPVIDVSNKAIEETTENIISLLKKNGIVIEEYA